jgi:hypothetical protein
MTKMIRAEDVPPLGVNEVHLWRIPLDDSRLVPLDLLEPVERARALRFRFAVDRHRFVQRRVAARRLLGRYCGIDPAHVRFSVNAYGKPSIADGGAGLHFNLTTRPASQCWLLPVRDPWVSLDSFDVSVAPRGELAATRGGFPGQQAWRLLDLPLPAGYVGAIAITDGIAPRVWARELYLGGNGQPA